MSQHCDMRAVFVLRPAEHCRVIEDADLYNVGGGFHFRPRNAAAAAHFLLTNAKTPRRVFHSAV